VVQKVNERKKERKKEGKKEREVDKYSRLIAQIHGWMDGRIDS
jgi:hypothetical protein